jgi:hypothetical protein
LRSQNGERKADISSLALRVSNLQIVVDAVLKEANSRFIVASELVRHIQRIVASFVFERQEDVEDGLAHESPDPATQAGLNRNGFQIQRC